MTSVTLCSNAFTIELEKLQLRRLKDRNQTPFQELKVVNRIFSAEKVWENPVIPILEKLG